MKKITALLLTLSMALSLAACTGSSRPERTAADTAGNISAKAGGEAGTDTPDSAADNPDVTEASGNDDTGNDSNILVAYFSATNTTKGVAEHIASGLGADLYEIVPEEPYSDADLDYGSDNSRSTIEMNDPSSRPAISGAVDNMEQYDIVFIGYPIWWGEAPKIVSTFMESYDFSEKTIVPFCTSGSSGIGSSASNLEELTDKAQWLPGQRFQGGNSQEEIMAWVEGLGLDMARNSSDEMGPM